MERERNNIGLVVAVIILAMLVVGLVGFIVYDKLTDKPSEPNIEDNDKNDEIKDKEVATSIDLTNNLITSLKFPPAGDWTDDWGEYENISIEALTRADMMHMASEGVQFKMPDETRIYDAKLIERNFKLLFGPDVNYYDGDIEGDWCCELSDYNDSEAVYYSYCSCGGDPSVQKDFVTRRYKAEQSDNYLYVYDYVQVLMINYDEDKVYLSNKNGDQLEVLNEKNYKSEIYKLMDEGKVATYKWTFKKQSDGKYYFYSGAWEN